MSLSRKFVPLVVLGCVAAVAAALLAAAGQASSGRVARDAVSASTTYQHFACIPPAGVGLPVTYSSFATVQGGHTTLWCSWNYASGTLAGTPFDVSGFPCHFYATNLPRSVAFFSSTHGTMTCTNVY
jgi:hypothetical protein